MKAPQKILLLGFMLFGKATKEYRYRTPSPKPKKSSRLIQTDSGYRGDKEGSPESDTKGKYYNAYKTLTKSPNNLASESSKEQVNYQEDSAFASVVSMKPDKFDDSIVNYYYDSYLQNRENQSLLSPNMEKIRESDEFKEVYIESMSENEMENQVKMKNNINQKSENNFSDNSLFCGNSDLDDNTSGEDKNDIQKLRNISDSSLLVDKKIVPDISSFLSPQKNLFNEKFNEKFDEARQHLLSFLNNLETTYVKSDGTGELEKDEHFIVEPAMKPLKFKIESKEKIDRYRGLLQQKGLQFYIGFYTDLKPGNEYVEYMDASKKDILHWLQNPTFLRLFVAIVGTYEVLKMKNVNNDPEKYTVNLINPFPLTIQAKSLIFGPRKQPDVRIICQYLGELNALELTSQQEVDKILNSTINDITDKNITLKGRELTVQYFMLFNQTKRNLWEFANLCVESNFKIKNKGAHNLIQENLPSSKPQELQSKKQSEY